MMGVRILNLSFSLGFSVVVGVWLTLGSAATAQTDPLEPGEREFVGEISDEQGETYQVRIWGNEKGMNFEYPDLECGGTSGELDYRPGVIVMYENLSYGMSNCINGGLVLLEREVDGTWLYSYDDGTYFGVLVENRLGLDANRGPIEPQLFRAEDCDGVEVPSLNWTHYLNLYPESFGFICTLDGITGAPSWNFALVKPQIGINVVAVDSFTAGSILDNLSNGRTMLVDIPDMLSAMDRMRPGAALELRLHDLSKPYHINGSHIDKVVLRGVAPGEKFKEGPKLAYAEGSFVGETFQMFADEDWFGLDQKLKSEAADIIDPMVSGMAAAIGKAALIKTRYASLITKYAIVRMQVHGDCGEATEEVVWESARWTEYKNGFGQYVGRSSPTVSSTSITVPLGFRAPFNRVGSIDVEKREFDLLLEIVRDLGCSNPSRRIVEQNMLRYYHHAY